MGELTDLGRTHMAVGLSHPVQNLALLVGKQFRRVLSGSFRHECLSALLYVYAFVPDQFSKDGTGRIGNRTKGTIVIDGTRDAAAAQIKVSEVAVKKQLVEAGLIDVMAFGGQVLHHRCKPCL